MLVGIMAKNGILIVEFANQLRDEGRGRTQAIDDASTIRLRPVMMTMISTVLGGVPLILSSGAGAEAREALGWVIVGGLGLATVSTLYLTPVAYLLLAGFSKPKAEETARFSGNCRTRSRSKACAAYAGTSGDRRSHGSDLERGIRVSLSVGGRRLPRPRPPQGQAAASPSISRACCQVATGRSYFSHSSRPSRQGRRSRARACRGRAGRCLQARSGHGRPKRCTIRSASIWCRPMPAAHHGASRRQALDRLDVEVEGGAVGGHGVFHPHDELHIERCPRSGRRGHLVPP